MKRALSWASVAVLIIDDVLASTPASWAPQPFWPARMLQLSYCYAEASRLRIVALPQSSERTHGVRSHADNEPCPET